jgi:hypothetical protein
MPTKKPRRTYTFSDDILADLAWLMNDEKTRRKKAGETGQFHECHLLAQLIRNEKIIRTAFKH